MIRIIVAFLSLFVMGIAYSDDSIPTPAKVEQIPQDHSQKSKQKPAADQRGTDTSPLHIKLLNTGKSQTQTNTETKQKEEETSINWRIMIFTGGLLAVAFFQLGMFWWQLRLTRTAARAAEKSATAAEESVKSIINSEAPYLLPDDFAAAGFFIPEGMDFAGLRPRITYAFKNHGRSPAIIRRWRDFTLFTDSLPKHPVFVEEWSMRQQQYIPIGAGEIGGELYAQIPDHVTRDEVLGVVNRGTGQHRITDRWLYVIGEVEYADIFNIIRIQSFCLKILVIYPGEDDEHGGVGPDRVFVWRDGGKEYNQRREVTEHS